MSRELNNNEKIIESNLHKVKCGDIFTSKTKLYAILGLKKPSGGKNSQLLDLDIKQYIKWELTKKPNRNTKKTSREIIITEIYEEKIKKYDGRINNGGAHNEKYINYVKPILLTLGTVDTTYKKIIHEVLKVPEWDVKLPYKNDEGKLIPREDRKHTKAVNYYGDLLESKLKNIIKSALNNLKKNEQIKFESIWMVNKSNSKGIFNFDYENLNWWHSVKIKQLLEGYVKEEKAFIQIGCSAEEYEQLVLMDFVRRCIDNKISADDLSNIFNIHLTKGKSRKANDDEVKIIDNMNAVICEILDEKYAKIMFKASLRREFQRRIDILLAILGWNPLFKVLSIDNEFPLYEEVDVYNYEKFYIELESFMREKIHGAIFNPYKSEVERRKKEHGENYVEVSKREYSDSDIKWLDCDEIWTLHNSIFKELITHTDG